MTQLSHVFALHCADAVNTEISAKPMSETR